MKHWSHSLKVIIETVVKRTDYHALYSCKIVSQNEDLSLELQPEKASMPPVSRVKIRLGIPNSTVKVSPGSTILMGFENGDPSAPYAALWGASEGIEISIKSQKMNLYGTQINLTEAAALAVARKTDPVASPGPTQCTIVLTAPLATPGFQAPAGTPIVGTVTFTPPLMGQITGGNEQVKA